MAPHSQQAEEASVGVAALVVGLSGFILAVLPFFPLSQMVAIVVGVVACALGYKGRKQSKLQGLPAHRAIAGFSLGALAFLISTLVFLAGVFSEKKLSESAAVLGEEFKQQLGSPEFRAAMEKARQAQRQGLKQLLPPTKAPPVASSPTKK
jgi:hypothetical protein